MTAGVPRQREAHLAAGAVADPDSSAVRLDQPPGDRESEARSAAGARTRDVRPGEAVERGGPKTLGEARAFVVNPYHDLARMLCHRACQAGGDHGSPRCVAQRVVHQVAHHPADRGAVGPHGHRLRASDRDRHALRRGCGTEGGHRLLHDHLWVDIRAGEGEPARLQSGEQEEVVDQRGQGCHVVLHGAQIPVRICRDPVLQGLQRCTQRRQRRPEIVTDAAEKHLSLLLQSRALRLRAGESRDHVVQRPRGLADLIGAHDVGTRGQVAVLDVARRVAEPADVMGQGP